jgi:hypothetical protein
VKAIAVCIAIIALSLSACAQKAAEIKTAETNTESIATPKTTAKLDTKLPWLQVKIWEYQSQPVSSPPRSVVKATFEGKTVYYVPAVCCDIPSELYAEDGALICYPSGGITGNGDGKCPKFRIEYLDNKDNKDNKKDNKTNTVWEDKRKPATSPSTTRVVPNLQ